MIISYLKHTAASQAISKIIPLQLLWRDQDVSESFIHDRLERKAAHGVLRGLVAQMDGLLGPHTLHRSRLPATVRLDGFGTHETLVFPPAGPHVFNRETGASTPVIPCDFRLQDRLTVCHTLDRGSVGRAAVWYGATAAKLLWTFNWGVCHDEWNALKAASKAARGGFIWGQVVRFSSVCNLNAGPFKSAAWGKQKQDMHSRLVGGLLSPDSDTFRTVACKQHALDGTIGDVDFAAQWERFSSLPSCVSAGPIIKFARWLSVNQAWDWYRGEIWLLRPVLEALRDDRSSATPAATTAQYDSEVQTPAAGSKKGILDRAPGHIQDSLQLALDMFTWVSRPIQERWSVRIREVTSVQDGVNDRIRKLEGTWQDTFRSIMGTFYDAKCVTRFSCLDPVVSQQNAELLFSFVTHLLRELAMRELPELFSPPQTFVALLRDDVSSVQARHVLSAHWRSVPLVERAATAGDLQGAALIADIPFLQMVFVRLGFFLILQDEALHPDAVGPEAVAMAEAASRRLYDEKAAEDVHGFIRDLGRSRRDKHCGIAAAFGKIRDSGVIEARGVHCPAVVVDEVIKEAWSQKTNTAQFGFPNKPEAWPDFMNTILLPKKTWPCPNTAGTTDGWLAWKWLLHIQEAGGDDGGHYSSSWWSRYLPEFGVVEGCADSYLVLYRSRRAAMVIRVAADDDGVYTFNSNIEGEDAISTLFVTDPRNWSSWAPDVAWCPGVGLGFRCPHAAEGRPTLLQDLLRRRSHLLPSDVDRALEQFGFAQSDHVYAAMTPTQRLGLLVRTAGFASPEEEAAINALYAKPPPPPAEVAEDEDLNSLLDDMVIDMDCNVQDLKAWQGELQKRHVRKIAQRRDAARKTKATRQRALKARKVDHDTKVRKSALGKFFRGKRRPAHLSPAANAKRRAPPPPTEPSVPLMPLPSDAPATTVSSRSETEPVPSARLRRLYAVTPPSSGGGWEVAEYLPHGWLRFNASLGRIDAHCAVHAKCKMDRSAAKGTLGLSLAWLQRGADRPCRDLHTLDKIACSVEAAQSEREAARDAFTATAATDKVAEVVIRLEERCRRGDRSEPAKIHFVAPIHDGLDSLAPSGA